jgi:hypothetical protein
MEMAYSNTKWQEFTHLTQKKMDWPTTFFEYLRRQTRGSLWIGTFNGGVWVNMMVKHSITTQNKEILKVWNL